MNYKSFKKKIETKDKIFDFLEETKADLCEAVNEVSETVTHGTKKLNNKILIQKIHFEIFNTVIKSENKKVYLVDNSLFENLCIEQCFIDKTEINLSEILLVSAVKNKINFNDKLDNINKIIWEAVTEEDIELDKNSITIKALLSNGDIIELPCLILSEE